MNKLILNEWQRTIIENGLNRKLKEGDIVFGAEVVFAEDIKLQAYHHWFIRVTLKILSWYISIIRRVNISKNGQFFK